MSPGPTVKLHKCPDELVGTQPVDKALLLGPDIIEPIKTEVGCISTFASLLKSKSVLVIPKLQISG